MPVPYTSRRNTDSSSIAGIRRSNRMALHLKANVTRCSVSRLLKGPRSWARCQTPQAIREGRVMIDRREALMGSLFLSSLLATEAPAMATDSAPRGMGRYIRRKSLDNLETYVPVVLAARCGFRSMRLETHAAMQMCMQPFLLSSQHASFDPCMILYCRVQLEEAGKVMASGPKAARQLLRSDAFNGEVSRSPQEPTHFLAEINRLQVCVRTSERLESSLLKMGRRRTPRPS